MKTTPSSLKGFLGLLILSLSLSAWGQGCRKSTVYFKSGKQKLKDKHIVVIDSVLNSLHPDTTYLIEAHGYTDERGSEESNESLSFHRAQSVMDYIRSKKLVNVVTLRIAHGERDPVSMDRSMNRRVSMLFRPINEDRTIILQGENGSQMRTPVHMFGNCGVCYSNPSLKSKTPHGKNGSVGGLYINIESNCELDVNCHSVEFRFPYNYFDANAEIKIPKPIYTYGCGPYRSKDSVDVKSDDSYETSYDTLTNEYVVTHDCYNPKHTMCCGTHDFCKEYRLIMPKQVELGETSYYVVNTKYGPNGKVSTDSLISAGDTNLVHFPKCLKVKDTIYGYGFLNGELVFLEESFHSFPSEVIRTPMNFYYYTVVHVPKSAYHPLQYKDTIVLLKIPRKMANYEAGYYIEAFDYYIPLMKMKRVKFSRSLLDYSFNIGLKNEDGIQSIAYSLIKKKYKKRKKLLKLKVKKSMIDSRDKVSSGKKGSK